VRGEGWNDSRRGGETWKELLEAELRRHVSYVNTLGCIHSAFQHALICATTWRNYC